MFILAFRRFILPGLMRTKHLVWSRRARDPGGAPTYMKKPGRTPPYISWGSGRELVPARSTGPDERAFSLNVHRMAVPAWRSIGGHPLPLTQRTGFHGNQNPGRLHPLHSQVWILPDPRSSGNTGEGQIERKQIRRRTGIQNNRGLETDTQGMMLLHTFLVFDSGPIRERHPATGQTRSSVESSRDNQNNYL